MASVTYLDTHVVVWLYDGLLERLPRAVKTSLERDRLLVSPMVYLEIQFLFEIGRMTDPAAAVRQALERAIGLEACDQPFGEVVTASLGQDWTRDPFDRLIVAQASLRSAPLITKDRHIRKHYSRAYWQRPRGA